MKLKYKTFLILIGLMLVTSITLGVGYFFYEPMDMDKSMISVIDEMSINYLNGEQIATKDAITNVSFSITNNSTEEKKYNIYLLDITNNSNKVTYSLQINDEYSVVNQTFSGRDERLSNNAKINPGETKFYNLKLNNSEEKLIKFKIYTEIG